MANIFTATENFPGELTYAGIKVISGLGQLTLSKIRASRPMYPSTAQNPIPDLNAHSRMILSLHR